MLARRLQASSILAQLLGDRRLLLAEEGKIDMHCGDGCRSRQHSEMGVTARLSVQIVDKSVAVIHMEACRLGGLTDRLRFEVG